MDEPDIKSKQCSNETSVADGKSSDATAETPTADEGTNNVVAGVMFQLDRTQFKTVRELSLVFGQGDNWRVYKGGKTMTGKASVIKKKQVLRPTSKKIRCREEHAGFDGCGKGYYRICKEITHTILARSNHRK